MQPTDRIRTLAYNPYRQSANSIMIPQRHFAWSGRPAMIELTENV